MRAFGFRLHKPRLADFRQDGFNQRFPSEEWKNHKLMTQAKDSQTTSDSAEPTKEQRAGQSGAPAGKPMSDKVTRMGTGSIPKLITEFAIPSIVGMVVNGAYNVIDSIFLGQAMGEIGLSTATVAMPIMTIFLALAMLVGNGGNALAALRLGEGRKDEANRSLGNTITLGFIIAVLVFVLARIPAVLDGLLAISGATPENWNYAHEFILIISTGFIFQVIGMGVNNFIRTAGAPNRALLTMVIGAVACTAFNYLFVMVLGWGVRGSALATILGQSCSCVSVLWYFTVTKGVPMRIQRRCLLLRAATVKMILSLGLASFLLQAAAAVLNFVINNLLNMYGAMSDFGIDGALASIGVVQRVSMFIVFPLIGMAVALQPLLGYNYGARIYERVRKTLWWGVGAATCIALVEWALIELFPQPVVDFFGIQDVGLHDFTVFALRVQVFMMPLVGFQIVGSNYFQATGQPSKAIFLSLTRQMLFLLPLYLFMPQVLPTIATSLTSLDALYFAVPIADGLAVFVTAIFIFFEMKRLSKLEKGLIQPKL